MQVILAAERGAVWQRGDLCYALVGDLEAADIYEMARRAAAALEGYQAVEENLT